MGEKENVCVKGKGAEQAAIAAEGTKREESCPALGSTAPKKFKDADALARAYGALEAEFTRRSQRIKELEKEVEALKFGLTDSAGTGAEKLRKNAEARRTAAKEFDKFVQGLEKTGADREKPEGENAFKTEVGMPTEISTETEFVNSDVQPLGSVVKGAGRENVLEEAQSENEGAKAVLQEVGENMSVALKKTQTALSSDELYSQVSQDEKVRLKIIGEYLSSLGKNVAPLTTGGVGAMLTPPIKAKSIAEAGNLALQYLKKPFDR